MSDASLHTGVQSVPLSHRPRLGFVGVGWIGRHRMEALVKADIADVTAVCDVAPDALAAAGDLAPDAACVTAYEDLLAHDLDGVVIATPNALHVPQALEALERGMHVFCQKPIARTADEARRIVDAARVHDRLLGVDFSYRHAHVMQCIREAVEEREIGDVFAVDAVFHNAFGPDKPWCRDLTLAGGGCVLDLGVHLVDLALWALDFPEVTEISSRLYAGGRRLPPNPDAVEDYATARLDLETGAVVDVACSWNLSAGTEAVIYIEFHGTEGGLQMRNVNGSFYDFVAEKFIGTSRETLVTPPDPWGGRALAEWASRVAAGEGFAEDAERFVDVARVLDGVYGR